MGNIIFVVSTASSLIGQWRTSNGPGTPLACSWVKVELIKLRSDGSINETGGLPASAVGLTMMVVTGGCLHWERMVIGLA